MKKIIKHYPMTDRLIVRRGYYLRCLCVGVSIYILCIIQIQFKSRYFLSCNDVTMYIYLENYPFTLSDCVQNYQYSQNVTSLSVPVNSLPRGKIELAIDQACSYILHRLKQGRG